MWYTSNQDEALDGDNRQRNILDFVFTDISLVVLTSRHVVDRRVHFIRESVPEDLCGDFCLSIWNLPDGEHLYLCRMWT